MFLYACLSDNLDETKRDMHQKRETSSYSESLKHDAEHTLQQSFINKSTLKHFNQMMHSELINKTTILNCDQISQSQSTFCSSLDDNISRTNDGGGKCDGKTIRWENCCNNPIKEMQRIEKYKADRRQRYYDQAKSKQTTSRYYARI